MPTLVIVDDDDEIRGLLRALALQIGLTVVGEASEGRAALAVLRKVKPDLAAIDLHLPFMSGIDVISTIHREHPEMKLIAITGVQHSEFIDGALIAGASAYLSKPGFVSELKATAECLLNGSRYLSGPALDRVWDSYVERLSYANGADLTERQYAVVQLVAEGLSNKEISTKLSLSVRTVEKHRAEAMERLQLNTSAELIRYAVRKGIVDRSR